MRTPVDFWFDPFCPWAWMTSRWLIEATAVRPIEPRWHLMSLHVLNEHKDIPDDYRRNLERVIEPVRVCAAAEEKYGPEVLGRLYTEIGTRFHNHRLAKKKEAWPETLGEALTAAGLDPALTAAMNDETYDKEIRRSHAEAIDLVGDEVGTPVISVEGVAFFGPVVTPVPKGEDAGKLWDGVLLVAGTDGFFELKRSRTRPPIFE